MGWRGIVTPEMTCFLSVEQPDQSTTPAEGSVETRDLGSDAPAALGNKRSPCCQPLAMQSFQSCVSRPPCPALPHGWPTPCGVCRVPHTVPRVQPDSQHGELTYCNEGKTHSKCSSVDTLCCFSNATYFSKQVILSMIMSLTKRKVLDGTQPCLFWKRAALSGPGTGTGPRTRDRDHARSHEWGETRGGWKRRDTFSFYRRS